MRTGNSLRPVSCFTCLLQCSFAEPIDMYIQSRTSTVATYGHSYRTSGVDDNWMSPPVRNLLSTPTISLVCYLMIFAGLNFSITNEESSMDYYVLIILAYNNE